ncbi:MAG TPA: HdeD family acid-resistance protein [Alphaproteobacteria bacterium]|nr:HdeD family acid-resistance protein [Alphaproteobacteria bacterium]
MIEALARNWWALALRGGLAVLLGILALTAPGVTLYTLILVLAGYFIADGVMAVVSAVRAAQHHERWWPFVLEGNVGIVAGIAMLLLPGLTAIALLALVAGWAIVTGLLMMAAAFRMPRAGGKWMLLINGALSLVLGVVMIGLPGAGLLTIAYAVGFYGIAFGIGMMALALRLRRLDHANLLNPASKNQAMI